MIVPVTVQGLCCPLQQRPSSGRVTHRVTPQSKGGGDDTLTLLTKAKGKPESRTEPDSGSRTRSRCGMTSGGNAISETAGESRMC